MPSYGRLLWELPLDRAVKDAVSNSAEDDRHRPRLRDANVFHPALNKSAQVFGCRPVVLGKFGTFMSVPYFHRDNLLHISL